MKKILFVATVHRHFLAFHLPYIRLLKQKGYEVHVAANDKNVFVPEVDKQFLLPISRNPFSLSNIFAIRKLKRIIYTEGYNLIHCHTAMGSVVARLAAKSFRKDGKLKILYTAHGFHFFVGAPKIFWWLYFPMEKYLAKFTDGLITINREDYEAALKSNFKAVSVFQTSGVGLNVDKFEKMPDHDLIRIRKKNGYCQDTFLIIYIAEFIERKDHRFILNAIPELEKRIDDFKFIFAGRGQLLDAVRHLAVEMKVNHRIDFLGFRNDIGELITMSNIGISVSKQEGLGMNLVEELFASKPVVATEIRGHKDIVRHDINGFLYEKSNINQFVSYISRLYREKDTYDRLSKNAKESVQKYKLENCLAEMEEIYKKML